MHYSSHPPRAFCNRIVRYFGVLVAAALVATLGLPSAAQAQTPAAPTVTGTGEGVANGDATITATWGPQLSTPTDQDRWLVEYTEPGVEWAKATELMFAVGVMAIPTPLTADDPRIHHGIWRFRVSYYALDDKTTTDVDDDAVVIGTASAITDYQHGPPSAAPTGFDAHPAGPDARRLVWNVVKGTLYDTRYTADATDDDEWTDWEPSTSGMVVDDLDMGVEYTFELRARAKSRAGVGDLHGSSVSHTEVMPMPTPTLPEIALLLLAMLLLGSGVYLLRGRQSGGLTHA